MGRGAHTQARDVAGLHYDTVQARVWFYVTDEGGSEGAILHLSRESFGFTIHVGRAGIEAIRDAANEALAALDA